MPDPRDQVLLAVIDRECRQAVGHRVVDPSDRDQLTEEDIDDRPACHRRRRGALAELGSDVVGLAGQGPIEAILGHDQGPRLGSVDTSYRFDRRPRGGVGVPVLVDDQSLFETTSQSNHQLRVGLGTGPSGDPEALEQSGSGQRPPIVAPLAGRLVPRLVGGLVEHLMGPIGVIGPGMGRCPTDLGSRRRLGFSDL